MLKKLFQDNSRFSFYLLLFMTVGLVVSGWINIYVQYIGLREATKTATQNAALEIVRSTARAANIYWVDQLKIMNWDPNTITDAQIRQIETQFFTNYIDPIQLLVPQGDAWVIGYDNEMVFDNSVDFPYFGMTIDQFLPEQAQAGGAREYDQMLSDVLNRHENTGEYIWLTEKGVEIGAWTPAVLYEKNNIKWMIGLTTPLSAVMEKSGANASIRQSIWMMTFVTLVVGIVFYGFVLGQRRVRALQKELAQLKVEIDQSKRQREVQQIVESEYFQSLKAKATELRTKPRIRRPDLEQISGDEK